jgi:predicted acylesterase/phospholipase RssA
MPRHCDIVMKGGITSGVVYPLAAVELSEHYRFKNVGGTSAGAIAAAAVAAAERGRSTGRGTGFGEVRELPAWLGANLTSLFQPQPATRPLFAIGLAAMAGRSAGGKAVRALVAAVRGFPIAAALGALPGAILAAASIASAGGFLLVWGLVCAALLLALGVTLGLAAALGWRALTAIPDNYFGLLTGGASEEQPGSAPLRASEEQPGSAPLTTWLADLLDRLAGTPEGEVLTFGALWGPGQDGERDVNLEMMTTSVTEGRPYRLPFGTDRFWFDPGEMRDLFPKRVVDNMVRNARPDDRADRFAPLVPLPAAADLPVVVATRMSLSFPILISAVPLHAIDFSEPSPDGDRRPKRCWFSDGGITSNFPVHFFDSPVPRWPTFAINLRKLPDDWALADEENENVWMAADNSSGGDVWWTDLGHPRPAARLPAFLVAVFRTMQNWVDNAQSRVHGYRDRIAHIEHTRAEGGLNLTMPPEVIDRLSARGECAGVRLRRRFAVPPEEETPLTWDNQRWIRYRSFMGLIEETLVKLRTGYREHADDDSPMEELSRREPGDPPDFAWGRSSQRAFAVEGTEALTSLAEAWEGSDESFADGAPEPAPGLRVAPRI